MLDISNVERTKTSFSSEIARERDRRYLWHPWSPLTADRAKLMLSHGDGYRVWDIDGNEYIDACSLSMICGYRNVVLASAINEQLMKLHSFDISIASHEPAGLLAERLANYLPSNLSKTLFINSGSEGFEAAIFIAASYWSHINEPRLRVITFANGYHGSTLISRSLSGLPKIGHPFKQALPVTHVKVSLSKKEHRKHESVNFLLEAFKNAINSQPDELPMAIVVEPFLNVGGGIVLPTGFLKGLRELCDKTGILLILDEVFTGYGRTGKMFSFQHEDISPDILVSSKGLASGYMPIAAVTVKESFYNTFAKDKGIGGLRYGHTTSAHPISCAAALATLKFFEQEGLAERATYFGKKILNGLENIIHLNNVVDIRGLGLITVIELDSFENATDVKIQAEKNGLLLRQHGENLMIVPPLTIDENGVNLIIERLKRSFAVRV